MPIAVLVVQSCVSQKGGAMAKFRKHSISEVLGGDVFAHGGVWRQIPLMLLILFYGIILVTGRYYVESLSKEKERLMQRVEYLREHRIMMQKDYQHSAKVSQIANRMEERGIGLTSGPPYEL